MHKKRNLTLAGIGALGAISVLLTGCGGNSFTKNSYGSYPNTLPYAYGVEPIAFYGVGNAAGNQAAVEGSGIQAASGGQAYLTGASGFTAVTSVGATLPAFADPNSTGVLPLGFSTNGSYVDAANQVGAAAVPVTSVNPGTSVIFRAALANGTASDNTAPGITGATLTSTDSQFSTIPGITAGLPMTLDIVGGAFSSATYATGTNGTAVPFTIPAGTTSGLHTVVVTVSDSKGRVTATTFVIPVVAATDVGLFLQSFTTPVTTAAPSGTKAITPGDTVTIDGGAGIGTYPTGFAPTTVDIDGTVVLFTTPGTHTVVETDPKGIVVQTATFVIPATTTATATTPAAPVAGATLFGVPADTTASSGSGSSGAVIRRNGLRRR
ncbi:MAG: hypothetical protein ACRYFS_05615 [Janthinobacterium lividum]